MTIGKIIKEYREKHKISQRQFALRCEVSNGYISMLEEGKNPRTNEPIVPSLSTIKKLATAMGMTASELMNLSDDMEISLADGNNIFSEDTMLDNIFRIEKRSIPLLGNVACGEPIFASESFDAYVTVGSNIQADFCLRAQGDSMINARILDGDIVFVRKQEMVNDGEIAVVLIGDEATIKRVYYDKEEGQLSLVPENPKYRVMRYHGEELNQIRILGKVIAGQYDIT